MPNRKGKTRHCQFSTYIFFYNMSFMPLPSFFFNYHPQNPTILKLIIE